LSYFFKKIDDDLALFTSEIWLQSFAEEACNLRALKWWR